MNMDRVIRAVAVLLATMGMCLPQVALAQRQPPPRHLPRPAVVDVALADGGVLHGQLVDLQSRGVANVPVSVSAGPGSRAQRRPPPTGDSPCPACAAASTKWRPAKAKASTACGRPRPPRPPPKKNALVYTQFGAGGGTENAVGQSHRDRRRRGHGHRRARGNRQLPTGQPVARISLPVPLASCHCFAEAVPMARCCYSTARAEQWHACAPRCGPL